MTAGSVVYCNVVMNLDDLKCIKGGTLSLLFLAFTINDVRRKLHMVEIHLTVGKRAKTMPDATVETTRIQKFKYNFV